MAGANADAIAAVRESAFRAIEWTDQATGVLGTNGIPTTGADGVALDSRSSFAYQIARVSGTVNAEITVWGYANAKWCHIRDHRNQPFLDGGLIGGQAGLGGMFTRVYLEVSVYTSGVFDLSIGVPKP